MKATIQTSERGRAAGAFGLLAGIVALIVLLGSSVASALSLGSTASAPENSGHETGAFRHADRIPAGTPITSVTLLEHDASGLPLALDFAPLAGTVLALALALLAAARHVRIDWFPPGTKWRDRARAPAARRALLAVAHASHRLNGGALAVVFSVAGVSPAFALTLNPGSEYHIKLTDATVPFHSVGDASSLGIPVATASQVVAGDLLRGITNITSMQSHATDTTVSPAEFNPIVEELTSVFYDLRVSRVTEVARSSTMTIVELGFVPARLFGFIDTAIGAGGTAATATAGFGGHIDFYREALGNGYDTRYTTTQGAGAFAAGGSAATAARPNGGDAYPGINGLLDTDDALVAEAVFAPLPVGAPCHACIPGVEVLNLTFGYRNLNGTIVSTYSRGFGFVNFIGGPLANSIEEGGIPTDVLAGLAPGMTITGAKAAGYDASLEISYRAPASVQAGASPWMASSEDPIHLTTTQAAVPAPRALALLLISVLMLGLLKREWRDSMITFGRLGSLAAATALAFLLPANAAALSLSSDSSYHMKLSDMTGAFRGANATTLGTPVTSVGALAPGDMLRGISQLTSLQFHATDTPVPGAQFDPNFTEITGMFYDLRLARITTVATGGGTTTYELGFVPGGLFSFNDTAIRAGATTATATAGFGGHMNLFTETKNNGYDTAYTTSLGATAFQAGAGAATVAQPQGGDAYPGLNTTADTDDTRLIEAVFAPLPVTVACFACTPDEVLLGTFTVNSAGVIGTGSGIGFLNVVGGSLAPSVLDGGIPADVLVGYGLTSDDAKALGLDISVELSFAAPSGNWLASSEDPLHFTTTATPTSEQVPAPAALGLMLVGVAVVGRSVRSIARSSSPRAVRRGVAGRDELLATRFGPPGSPPRSSTMQSSHAYRPVRTRRPHDRRRRRPRRHHRGVHAGRQHRRPLDPSAAAGAEERSDRRPRRGRESGRLAQSRLARAADPRRRAVSRGVGAGAGGLGNSGRSAEPGAAGVRARRAAGCDRRRDLVAHDARRSAAHRHPAARAGRENHPARHEHAASRARHAALPEPGPRRERRARRSVVGILDASGSSARAAAVDRPGDGRTPVLPPDRGAVRTPR